jgi:hypothetical protein
MLAFGPFNYMEQCPSWELIVTQLVKKFPTFYGTQNIHYYVHKNPPLVPYPEPDESSPHLPTLFPWGAFKYYHPIYA